MWMLGPPFSCLENKDNRARIQKACDRYRDCFTSGRNGNTILFAFGHQNHKFSEKRSRRMLKHNLYMVF